MRTFWTILWCLENVNIPSLIADEVAQHLCYLKCFIKKKPKLEKEEVTCDESFEIWQMINMAYQMLQYFIFLFVLYTVLFVFCNSNMYSLIVIGILQMFMSKLWFI